jgi:predicted ATP-dependent endonuclease of OLD family
MFIDKIKFDKDFRCFKVGDEIPFEKNITLLVGNNGTGKSTILDILRCHFKIQDKTYLKTVGMDKYVSISMSEKVPSKILYFDFHSNDSKFSGSLSSDIVSQMQAQRTSSGLGILMQFVKTGIQEYKNSILILDEPCRGLSPFWQERMKNMIFNLSFENQVIVSTHSERIMSETFATIFSVEHKKEFLTVDDFLAAHLAVKGVS